MTSTVTQNVCHRPFNPTTKALQFRAWQIAQREGGNEHGSWDSVDAWGEDGGRVYSTAILALTLQAHYRYGRLAGR